MPQNPKTNPRPGAKGTMQKKKAQPKATAGKQQQPRRPRKIISTVQFETKKQMQNDPRVGHRSETERLDLTTQVKALIEPVTIEQYLIEDFARGFVMKAMEKGFAALADLPQYPYYAYVYIVNLMRNLINNETQLVATVPYCILQMCRAVRTKSVPFGNGSVTYTSVCPPWIPSTPTVDLGYAPYGITWSICPIDYSNIVNLKFPTLTPTVTYDSAQGAQAYQRICQILVEDNPNGPCRLVPVYINTELDSDCSAFAYHRQSFETIGLSSQGTSSIGASGTMNLEVPIFRPQFAAFNSIIFEPATVQRFGNLHCNTCGDGTFLAAGLCTWFTPEKFRMQRPPKLHFVDFLEFGDYLGKWVAGIQQAFVNDPANATVDPTLLTCTLSLQEAALVLRNVLMTAFKESQAGAHAIYPVIPASVSDNQFVPFIVGANTCFLAQTDMRLPTPLIENIRALVMRVNERDKKGDFEVFYPVLGQKKNDQLNFKETDYSFKVGETTYPSFRPSSVIGHKKEVTKAGVTYRPLVESQISFIDGSSTDGLVCINNPNALKSLTSDWEQWLVKSGVEAYSTDVSVLGTEQGISICASSIMDRFIGVPVLAQHVKAMKDKEKALIDIVPFQGPNFRKLSATPSSIYSASDRQVSLDMSQSKILATVYEQVLSVWILPTVYFNVDQNNMVTPIRWEAINDEPFSQIRSDGAIGTSLDDLHASFAAKCVRNKLAKPTDWEGLFTELARTGRGGILTDLVSRFADAVIPGSGGIVKTIGGAIGV